MAKEITNEKEKYLLELALTSKDLFVKVLGVLEPDRFDKPLDSVVGFAKTYFGKYHSVPELDTIKVETGVELTARSLAQHDFDYAVDEIELHCQKAALTNSILLAVDELNGAEDDEPDFGKIEKLIRDAITVSVDKDLGLNFFADPASRLRAMIDGLDDRGIGWPQFDSAIGNVRRGELILFVGGSGAGKCFGVDTPILMYDGTIKKVQDVRTGDVVMGNDSTPRRVLDTTTDKEELFKVTPIKGEPYIVNRSHILSLRHKVARSMLAGDGNRYGYDEVINISVNDYLKSSKKFKVATKGWRSGVDFEKKQTPDLLPPYLLGLWLGDGAQLKAAITTPDDEIVEYILSYCMKFGFGLRKETKPGGKASSYFILTGSGKKHPLLETLRDMGVTHTKHIPHIYKCSSREDRLELLAGILDTDGHLSHNVYDIVLKDKQLMDDVVYLARSLGLAAYSRLCKKTCYNNGKVGDYYRCCISGDIDMIPCKIKRKRATPRTQVKDVLRTGISIESIGIGDYYGFQVDGNHLFLLGDFTVVHNSVVLANVARLMAKQGLNTLLITLELSANLVAKRLDSMITGISSKEIFDKIEDIDALYNVIHPQYGNLYIKKMPPKSRTIDIRAYLMEYKLNFGYNPDVLVVDYMGIMGPNVKSKSANKFDSDEAISEELRELANDTNAFLFTASQFNREGSDVKEKRQSHIAGGISKINTADAVIAIKRTEENKDDGTVLFQPIKLRNAEMSLADIVLYWDNKTLEISDKPSNKMGAPSSGSTRAAIKSNGSDQAHTASAKKRLNDIINKTRK